MTPSKKDSLLKKELSDSTQSWFCLRHVFGFLGLTKVAFWCIFLVVLGFLSKSKQSLSLEVCGCADLHVAGVAVLAAGWAPQCLKKRKVVFA